MERGYQHGYSENTAAMFDLAARQKKAKTMICVLTDFIGAGLGSLSVLNVGGSAGAIDEYLARYFRRVVGVDIDEKAIAHAKNSFEKDNLVFEVGDAMNLSFDSNSFDVVVCSQVYEHVMNADTMMKEIFRVIKPGGVVYFAAGNRLMLNEPHYNLPLLSVFPRPLSHLYLKICGKGSFYYEKHLSYWGLKKLVAEFEVTDYTGDILRDPVKYDAGYMIQPGSSKQKIAIFMENYLFWLVPGYIWILKKPYKTNS